MKKKITFLIILITIIIKTNAQIPNSGFENWTTVGSYQNPTFWGTTNSYSMGPFYAVTKSTEHYPVSVGNYSVKIENKTSLLPSYSGKGYLSSGQPPPGPDFQITGHPLSLTGYYKFTPLNGDTMLIQIQLYYNGSSVSYGEFKSTTVASGWTSFDIPFSSYTTADSGSIFISAYYANGFNYLPHGNSVLYVDNLSFDTLIIGSVAEQSLKKSFFNLYPNPASDIINLNINNSNNEIFEINIYDVVGKLMHSEILKQNQKQINIENLVNGIYMVSVKSKSFIENQRLIIQN